MVAAASDALALGAISSFAIRNASPMPTIWWVGSVPERIRARGRRRASAPRCARAALRRTNSAPTPFGTVGLVRREAHQVDLQRRQVDRDLPVACAASTWKTTRACGRPRPSPRRPGSTPISLFTSITDATIVSGAQRRLEAATGNEPSASTSR